MNLVIDGPAFITLLRALDMTADGDDDRARRCDALGLPSVGDHYRDHATRLRELAAQITERWCTLGISDPRKPPARSS